MHRARNLPLVPVSVLCKLQDKKTILYLRKITKKINFVLQKNWKQLPVAKKIFVVRYSRYEIENLVVRYGMRSQEFPEEFVDTPSQYQISYWNEIENDDTNNRKYDRKVAQVRDSKIEQIFYPLAETRDISYWILNRLRYFLYRLQTFLQALLFFLNNKGNAIIFIHLFLIV